jgi:TolA-binding protein
MGPFARLRTTAALALLPGSLVACADKPLVVETPTIDANDDQQATCKVAKDPLNPLIIEWPGTSKVDLDVRSQHGLVAVSYAGCTLKVLPSCDLGGRYALTKVTPARDRMEMSTASDLYARLPLGAASLKAELATGSRLELDYVAVGQRLADAEPSPPRGVCAGATHYVRSITVGAYSLDATATGSAGAGVDVAGAGLGGGRREGAKRVRGSGDVDACATRPDDPSCSAVIQLSLMPLPNAEPYVVAETSPKAAPAPREPSQPAPQPAATAKPATSTTSASTSPPAAAPSNASVEALRDPTGLSTSTRPRKTVDAELQNVEAIVAVTAKNAAERPDLLFRAANLAREGAAVSAGDPPSAAKLRAKALGYFGTLLAEAPSYGRADEALYLRGLELDRAGDPDRARLIWGDLFDKHPSSKYVPYAHYGVGLIHSRDAAQNAAKWSLAERAFEQVTKYPKTPLYAEGLLGLARAQDGRGKREEASATYRKLASDQPSSRAARDIPSWAK